MALAGNPYVSPSEVRKRRLLEGLLAAVLFALGWSWLLGQNARVFERQPDHAVERLVADTVPVPFPKLMDTEALAALCKRALPWWAPRWPGEVSERVAACLSDPAAMDEARADALLASWTADLQGRIALATRWADEYDKTYAARRKALEAQLHAIQGKSGPVPAAGGADAADPFSADGILRAPVQGQAGRQLREHAARTQSWLNGLLAQTDRPVAERAAQVGLLIAGKQVQRDFGKTPPRLYLNSDSNSLAEHLEWRRRAQGHVADGLTLPRMAALLQGVMLASVVLVATVAWLRMAVMPWVLVSLLLGIGCLLLVDMGISADASFRSLAYRQWKGFEIVDASWAVWWPLLGIAAVLVCLRHPRVAQSRPAQLIGGWVERWWVQWGYSDRFGWLQPLLILALGMVVLGLPGISAAKSEIIIGLGCLGLATFLAREAALVSAGGNLWPPRTFRHWARQEWLNRQQKVPSVILHADRRRAWQLSVVIASVLTALVVALGLSINRGDLGHALVAAGMAGVFFWLFAGRKSRGLMLLLGLVMFALLALIYFSQSIPGFLQAVVRGVLPYHAQERFLGMVDPLAVTASDMARVRWLMDSAGATGWGAGWVPWGGLGEVRLADGVPLQGPSDYVPALLVAQWGAIPAAVLMLLVLGLFIGGAVVGGRTALAQGVSPALRLMAGVGLFGCVLMAFKVVLSLGGVTGVLPLTGLPVALVGYGPVSTVVGLLYLALAFGTQHHRRGATLHLQPQPVLRGGMVRQGKRLAWVAGVATALLSLASLARMNAPLSHPGSVSACDQAQRDVLGQLIPVQLSAHGAMPEHHRNAQPHCAASAYRLTQALVMAMQQAEPPPQNAARAQDPADPVPGQAASAAASPAPEPPDTDQPPADGFVDDDGGLVSATLAAERAAQVAVPSPVPGASPGSRAVCTQMGQVVEAWNQRLAALKLAGAAHLQGFNVQGLFTHLDALGAGWRSHSECVHRARELGLLLQGRLPLSLEAGGRPVRGEATRFQAFFDPSASKAVTRSDFETPNAWRGLPGCIVPAVSLEPGRTERRCTVEDRAARLVEPPQPTTPVSTAGRPPARPEARQDARLAAQPKQEPLERVVLNNFWLQQQLAGRLTSVKGFGADDLQFEWRRHTLQSGPVSGLTLDPGLQDLAQRIAECYTGQRRGAEACADVLPADPRMAQQYFGTADAPGRPRPMRAGAMGLVLAEVDSGRVVAFANAISDCSLEALATTQPYERGSSERPVIGNIQPEAKDAPACSPWPDKRRGTEFLALQAPALWLVPPGSSLKPLVVIAGVDAGVIKPSDRDRWRTILARSHDVASSKTQNDVKQVAIAAPGAYRDVLHAAGFMLEPPGPGAHVRDLLWGDPAGLAPDAEPTYGSRWSLQTELVGHQVELNGARVPWRLPQNLSWPRFLDMWQAKQTGLAYASQVQRFGADALGEYPFAQALANATIGGGDIRVSAMGLADVWRSIDLQARKQDKKAALHLLEAPALAVPRLPLALGGPNAAELALYATSGIVGPKGTAEGSCRRVFGDCSPSKVDTSLRGKTGTSDFTQANNLLVKPGLDLPAKLFGGVFEHQGKRYAVAAVGLRVRVGNKLDGSSASAEAALTLMREMQKRDRGPSLASTAVTSTTQGRP